MILSVAEQVVACMLWDRPCLKVSKSRAGTSSAVMSTVRQADRSLKESYGAVSMRFLDWVLMIQFEIFRS
jgi:hypothetical protein